MARAMKRGVWQRVLPWGMVAAGAGLRAFHCERHGFGFDEVFALNKAWQPTVRGVAEAAIVTEPSLYHFVLHALTNPGWPEWALRGMSIACSAGALAVLWLLLRRLVPRPVGLASLALVACSPFQIMKAQAVRPYALCELLSLGAALAVVQAAGRPGRGAPAGCWAIAGGLALLAVATHPLAILWLVCVPLFLLLTGRGSRAARSAVLAGLPAVALALVWAGVLREHRFAAAGTLAAVPWTVFAEAVLEWFGAGSFLPAVLREPALDIFALAAVAGLMAEALAWRKGRAAPVGLILGLLPLLLLYAGHRAGFVDHPRPRYGLDAQVFLLAACARGLWMIPATGIRAAGLAVLLALEAGPALRATAGGPPEVQQPFDAPVREAAALIRGGATPGEVAASVNFEGYVPLAYYLAGAVPVSYAEADPYFGVPNGYAAPVPLARSAARARGLWLVIAPVRYFSVIGPHLAAEAELRRAGFVRRDVRALDGLRIEHWRPAR